MSYQGTEKGRLAAPVGADERHALAGHEVGVDRVEQLGRSDRQRELGQAQDGHGLGGVPLLDGRVMRGR